MSEEPGNADRPFEERLRAARDKQGLDAPARRSGPDLGGNADQRDGGLGSSPWGIGLRVGVELAAALFVAVAIGYGLDLVFGTRPILTAAFVPVGGAAGVLNVWRLFKPGRGG
jgi:ATP synthase protein I